jgi:2-pyrone-4,6-dicarboxylate lactonase
LQVDLEAGLIEASPVLAALPVPVVVDHMGRVDASLSQNQPPFEALLRMMDHDNVRAKVSVSERAFRQNPPYSDATPNPAAAAEGRSDPRPVGRRSAPPQPLRRSAR